MAVGGATSATYTTPTLVYATDGADRYRCIVSLVGAAGSLTSNFAVLTVLRVITIQTQPQSQAVIEGALQHLILEHKLLVMSYHINGKSQLIMVLISMLSLVRTHQHIQHLQHLIQQLLQNSSVVYFLTLQQPQ